MRSEKAIKNITMSLLLQLVTIISGLVIPRLIIGTFGSDVNGLMSSINQFLSYIVLIEAGVGGITRAALYEPLANKNIYLVSAIMKATESFFKKVAFIFLIYLILVAFLFPRLVDYNFDGLYTALLIIIMGLSSFTQYYFGISYQILLQADQKQYISSILQIFSVLINTLLIIVFIKVGSSIHTVKLASSFIFILKPLFLKKIINHKYKLDHNVSADTKAIKQKWDGFGHHIAFLIHSSTDIAILTIFSNIKEVSVYSVYLMIVTSIRNIIVMFSSSLEAAFGNMIAKKEEETLRKNFSLFEYVIFSIVTVLFTSAAILIIPFVTLYTKGITDANYIRPLFAYLLITADVIYCIRIPYQSVVLAAGHYKQTRNGSFIEAFLNVFLSMVFVFKFGIIGVAFGTTCAMFFRTIQYVNYLSGNIIKRSIWKFWKRTLVFLLSAVMIILITKVFPDFIVNSYSKWIFYALFITTLSAVVTLIIGILFYKEDFNNMVTLSKRLIHKTRKK